jgi:hypothetical protein
MRVAMPSSPEPAAREAARLAAFERSIVRTAATAERTTEITALCLALARARESAL